MDKITGGPAFPRIGRYESSERLEHGERLSYSREPQEGMTLRDYFAAHTPAEPQAWFTPTYDFGTPHQMMDRWGSSWGDTLKEHVDAERRVQWPYAWADQMIRERGI